MEIDLWVGIMARAVEVAGVATIIAGAIASAVVVVVQARGDVARWYPLYRRYFGHALLLGLEFLVAADIIRTVSHIPSLENVFVLGMIVLIRTFLSFTLEVELDGHWPWQKTHLERKAVRPPAPPPA